jgi:hypothetical protein
MHYPMDLSWETTKIKSMSKENGKATNILVGKLGVRLI